MQIKILVLIKLVLIWFVSKLEEKSNRKEILDSPTLVLLNKTVCNNVILSDGPFSTVTS